MTVVLADGKVNEDRNIFQDLCLWPNESLVFGFPSHDFPNHCIKEKIICTIEVAWTSYNMFFNCKFIKKAQMPHSSKQKVYIYI